MSDYEGKRHRQIGELAEEAGTSTDTVRYYERLGLLEAPNRATNGYRIYTDTDLGRLRFIRRAKHLGCSLREIRDLLGVAQEGQCQPLRRQMTELLARKIAECEAQLAELSLLKSGLEEQYRLALDHLDEPACQCPAFPATCGCLPVQPVELDGLPKEAPHEQRFPRATPVAPGAGAPSG